MADVIEVNDFEQLQSYRLLWNSLHPQTAKASFFHTFDWFETYWKHFGQNRQLRALIIYGADKPIGIVPFCVQQERYAVGNVRVLTYPLTDWGMWYGPIGPNPTACLLMAMRHLHATPRDWDLLDLRWIPACQGILRSTDQALRLVGWHAEECDYQSTSNIELSGYDWDSYFASRSKKWRHETRRQQRALERHGKITFERHRPSSAAQGDGDPNWEIYESCLEVSRNSWQADSNTGNTLCHHHVEPFLRECHEVAARLGMLDVALLRLDGKPVAFQYNYHHDQRVFGLRMGYAHDYAKLGTGNVLFNLSLEDSFARGDQLIEMGIGESRFKQRMRTKVETSHRILYYPWAAWRAQGVRLTRLLKSRRAETASKAAAV